MLDNDAPERRFRLVLPEVRPLDLYDDSFVGDTVTEATYNSRDLKDGNTESKGTFKSRDLKEDNSISEVVERITTTTTQEPTKEFTTSSNDFVLKLIFKK